MIIYHEQTFHSPTIVLFFVVLGVFFHYVGQNIVPQLMNSSFIKFGEDLLHYDFHAKFTTCFVLYIL